LTVFTHLHLHTESSVADSILKLDQALLAVRADGQRAMAITDHGSHRSHFPALIPRHFGPGTSPSGVEPLLGVEAYLDAGLPPYPDGYPRLCHLVLIAKNIEGYQNLVRLQRWAWTHNLVIGRFPALTLPMIEQFHRGLICTTACVGGPVGRPVTLGLWDVAEDLFLRFNDLFDEDFYGEVSAHPLAEQPEINRAVALFSGRAGRRIVQTVDSHYLGPADWISHDCLLKTKDKRKSGYRYPAACFYLAPEWRVRGYGFNPEWIDETNRVAEKCSAAAEVRAAILTAASVRGGPQPSAAATAMTSEELFLSKTVPITPYDALRSVWVWAGLPPGGWSELAAHARRIKRMASVQSYPVRAFSRKYPNLWSMARGLAGLPRAVCPDFRHKILVSDALKDLIPVRTVDGLPVAEIDCVTARALHLPVRQTAESEREPHKGIEEFYRGLAFWWNDRPRQALRAFQVSIAAVPSAGIGTSLSIPALGRPCPSAGIGTSLSIPALGRPCPSALILARIRLAQSLRELGRQDESDKWLRDLRQDPHVDSLHLKKFVMAIGRPAVPVPGIQLELYPEVAVLSMPDSITPDFGEIRKACEPAVAAGIRDVIVSGPAIARLESRHSRAARLNPVLARFRKYLKSRAIDLHINLDISQIPSRIDPPAKSPPTRERNVSRSRQRRPIGAGTSA